MYIVNYSWVIKNYNSGNLFRFKCTTLTELQNTLVKTGRGYGMFNPWIYLFSNQRPEWGLANQCIYSNRYWQGKFYLNTKVYDLHKTLISGNGTRFIINKYYEYEGKSSDLYTDIINSSIPIQDIIDDDKCLYSSFQIREIVLDNDQ